MLPALDKTSVKDAMVKGNTLFVGATGADADRASFSVTIDEGKFGILVSCLIGGLLAFVNVGVGAAAVVARTRSISSAPHLDDCPA